MPAPIQGRDDTLPSAFKRLTAREVRTLRRLLGLSQQRFGDLLFVSRQTVWRWETGQMIPSLASTVTMRRLAAVLKE